MNNAVADVHRMDVTAVNPELGAVRHTSPSSPGGSNDDPTMAAGLLDRVTEFGLAAASDGA
jgi:hypothetical protein